jgi:hypothetical protein
MQGRPVSLTSENAAMRHTENVNMEIRGFGPGSLCVWSS